MSDQEFEPIHKFFRETILSIKYSKNTNTDGCNNHSLGLLGYCKTIATFHPTQVKPFRFENFLKLLDICHQ